MSHCQTDQRMVGLGGKSDVKSAQQTVSEKFGPTVGQWDRNNWAKKQSQQISFIKPLTAYPQILLWSGNAIFSSAKHLTNFAPFFRCIPNLEGLYPLIRWCRTCGWYVTAQTPAVCARPWLICCCLSGAGISAWPSSHRESGALHLKMSYKSSY